MNDRRAPVSISLSGHELERLDKWAREHEITRSAAVRALVLSTRSPGQTILEDFADEVASDAEAAVRRASEGLSSKETAPEPRGIVAQAEAGAPQPVCFKQPSDLLGGRCIGGLRGAHGAPNTDPTAPACPACWNTGTTGKMTRDAARQALAAERSAAAEPVILDALRRFHAEGQASDDDE